MNRLEPYMLYGKFKIDPLVLRKVHAKQTDVVKGSCFVLFCLTSLSRNFHPCVEVTFAGEGLHLGLLDETLRMLRKSQLINIA